MAIPNDMLMDGRLNRNEILVWLNFKAHFNNKTGACYPSRDTQAKELNMSTNAVSKARGVLEEKGYVVKKQVFKENGEFDRYQWVLLYPEAKVSQNSTSDELTSDVKPVRRQFNVINKNIKQEEINKNIIAAETAAKKEAPNPVNQLIKVFYDGGSGSANFQNKTHRAAAEWLIKKLGFPESVMLAQKAMSLLKSGDPFVPKADNVFLMKEKLVAIQNHGTKNAPKKPTFTRTTI